MKKRIIALMLGATLAMSTLAGCGNNNAQKDTESTAKNSSAEEVVSSATSEEASKATEEVPKATEFEYFSSLSSPYKESTPIYDKLMEETGITVNFSWVAKDSFETILSSRIAEKDLPDVIGNLKPGAYTQQLIDEGLIVPLQDVLKEKMPNYYRFLTEEDLAIMTDPADGNIYAFGYILDQPGLNSWAIRGDWLDDLGLEVPETWDQWVNAWRKFKETDLNGNGQADEIPLIIYGGAGDEYLNGLKNVFGIATNDNFSIYEGEYYYDPEHPRYMEFLDAVKMLYDEGLIPAEYVSIDGTMEGKLRNSGVVGSFYKQASTATQSGKALGENDPDAIWLTTKPIKGPHGDQIIAARDKMTNRTWITTAALEEGKLDAICEFFDYVFSDEGIHITNYGIEGETYKMVDGKPVLQEPYVLKFATAREYGIIPSTIPFYFSAEVYDTITNGGMTEAEMDKWTLQGVYGISKNNIGCFYTEPLTYTVEAIAEYSDLMEEQQTLQDKYIIGQITKDKYLQEYEALKKAGLNEVIEQTRAAYHTTLGE